MNDQKKLFFLLGLVVVLIVVAVVVFGSSSRRGGRAKSRPVKSADEEKPVAKLTLLSDDSIAELDAWLGAEAHTAPAIKVDPRGRFGLPIGAVRPTTGKTGASPIRSRSVSTVPPELGGIIVLGATQLALFDGVAYEEGQTIAGTGFKVVQIGEAAVKLANEVDDVYIVGLQK